MGIFYLDFFKFWVFPIIFVIMKKEKAHGGSRKGAGRKPVADPKVGVTLYIENSVVETLGGVEAIRTDCYTYLKSKVVKMRK